MNDYLQTNFQPNWFGNGYFQTNSDEYAKPFWATSTKPTESIVPQTNVNPRTDVSSSLGKSWGQTDFGDKAKTIFGGINALANLYGAIQSIGIAKKQFRQQQAQWNATWDAQRKTHNEALGLRAQLRNNGQAAAVRREYNQYKI